MLVITPPADYFGNVDDVWLNVTDSSSTISQQLSIDVESVPDLPILNLMNVNIIDDTAATIAWSVFDSDGAAEHGLEIALDGMLKRAFNPHA